MQISSAELAQCLGLSVDTPYHVKELQETVAYHPTLSDIVSAEISSPVMPRDDTASSSGKPTEPGLPDSVPTLMLPPRKRLKAVHCNRNTYRTEDIGGRSAGGENYGLPADKCDENSDLGMIFESGKSPKIQPDSTVPVSTMASATAVDDVVSISSSDEDVVMNLISTAAKNSFGSVSAPIFQAAFSQQKLIPRGQKSYQTPAANPEPMADILDWTATNGDREIGTTPPTLPETTLPAPAPNVIHIPEDARVVRTDDGLIIVCQSDGTVQIHGHTEGQPIPLDAIRSLLALDTADQTSFAAAGNGKHIPQETSHAPYSHAVPLNTDYAPVDQMMGTPVDAQNVVSVDGRQYVAVDGSQMLMAYDPNSQSIVQIDPGQAFITLSADNGNAVVPVAVDGAQPVLSFDGGCQQGVVSNSALVRLLPSDHMQ